MAHPKRILVPIDDKEHCMRAFDCKYITAAEYFAVAFNSVSALHVFPKLESSQRLQSNFKAKESVQKQTFKRREASSFFRGQECKNERNYSDLL